MKKAKQFLAMSCAVSLIFAGCGSSMPDLSKEQSAVISEYAASLLLKYDKDYNGLLEEVQEVLEEPETIPDVSGNTSDKEDRPEQDSDEEGNFVTGLYTTVQDFYGLEGLEFTYAGWTLTESYSEDESSEIALAFDAAEGNVLAAAEFYVKNVSAEPVSLNMLELEPSIRLEVGGQVKKVQPTMLLNELVTFVGTIQPEETLCLVLIAEYEENTVRQTDSISILLRNESTNATIQLN